MECCAEIITQHYKFYPHHHCYPDRIHPWRERVCSTEIIRVGCHLCGLSFGVVSSMLTRQNLEAEVVS